jgi:DNA-binding response OmpR family regulator
MPAARLLIVEDDDTLRPMVAERLAEEGYAVETAADGEAALERVEARVPDLIVLDVMLPGLDGLEVCRRVRAEHPHVYVLMLTARTDEIDRVVGLEVGADDYVTKPFSLKELVARVRAALRRMRLTSTATEAGDGEEVPLRHDGLRIDPVRRTVEKDGEAIHLTVREFDLLLFLAQHPGRPFTRAQLLDRVWDIQYEGYSRTVDSHVQRLRAKIEDDSGDPHHVRTVWGVGYKFGGDG